MDQIQVLLEAYVKDANQENATGTERGVVLVWASILDDVLLRILDGYTDDIPNKEEALFRNQAPFGTFSARGRACLALGLISQQEFQALSFVRKLRNDFAHKLGVSLEHSEVKRRCIDFAEQSEFPHRPDTPRLAFIAGSTALLLRLFKRLESAQGRKVHALDEIPVPAKAITMAD